MGEENKYLKVDWKEVELLCFELAMKIKESYKPDVIIAIARGGLVPARILSDFLGIKEILTVGVEYYKAVEERKELPKLTYSLPNGILGKRVLVVDDVADTGKSLDLVKRELGKFMPRDLKFATLFYKPWCDFKPDFYAKETEKWVIFPWEKIETARELGFSLASRIGYNEHELSILEEL